MADPGLEELTGGGGGGRVSGFDLLALLAFLPSVISSFLTQKGGAAPPGSSPRSVTGNHGEPNRALKKCVVRMS